MVETQARPVADIETKSVTRRRLKLAILGTRGIPANYGGFETFAEELSIRLVQKGHDVTVYGRSHYSEAASNRFEGVQLRWLPAIRSKYLDTISHTSVSIVDALFRSYDALLICNAANAFLSGIPRLRGQKVVLNVDGVERRRQKWNMLGREFYRISERISTVFPNKVVTDALSVQSYYLERYGFDSRFIPYGARMESITSNRMLRRLGVRPKEYLLYVSRLEPENNAHNVISSYLQSGCTLPLLLVGDAPYSKEYIANLKDLARLGNVVMPGAIYGEGFRELLAHSCCYLHGCEVGGTHPALLEAMAAGSVVISNDTEENREVLGDSGLYCRFEENEVLASLMRSVVEERPVYENLCENARDRVRRCYDWERVTDQYEALFYELIG